MSKYPTTIDNGHGERLTFVALTTKDGLPCMNVENLLMPGSGPPMHVHFKQDECLTVMEGQMGVQLPGREPEIIGVGESITFKSGIYHRFYNAGKTPLRCTGQVWPVYNIEYFLTAIYKSAKANKNGRPDPFDAAYLLHRYRSEFDMQDIPPVVKKVIFPVILVAGRLQGKHKKFSDAPAPV